MIERLAIPASVLAEIVEQARRGAPLEICGLLAGSGETVVRAYQLTNVTGREDYYTADPFEQMAVFRTLRDEGLESLAIYHSHPASPARPSAEDIANANDPDVAYVIVSLLEPASPVTKAFSIRDGESREIPIDTTED